MEQTNRIPIRIVFLPHFWGEGQDLYDAYFAESEKFTTVNGFDLYVNRTLGLLLCLTGVGKVNSAMCVTSVLADSRFDFSDAKIIACGCAGSAVEVCTLCDVCIATAVCDFDLGHTADIRDMADPNAEKLWFYEADTAVSSWRLLNVALCDAAYEQAKTVPLETTDLSRRVMAENFNNADWAVRDPVVCKGTILSGDDFWKGKYGHQKSVQIAKHYGCPDPYAMTEMEDVAIAVAADRFGMLDRLLVVRVGVNTDVFLKGDSPELLWGKGADFGQNIQSTNSETLDCFGVAIQNMFRVVRTLSDAILNGTL